MSITARPSFIDTLFHSPLSSPILLYISDRRTRPLAKHYLVKRLPPIFRFLQAKTHMHLLCLQRRQTLVEAQGTRVAAQSLAHLSESEAESQQLLPRQPYTTY